MIRDTGVSEGSLGVIDACLFSVKSVSVRGVNSSPESDDD